MASISKGRTAKGGYEVRWRDFAGRNRRRWSPTKEGAKDLKLAIEVARANGIDWRPPDAAGPLSLEDLFKQYLRSIKHKVDAKTLKYRDIAIVAFIKRLEETNRAPLSPKLLSRSAVEDFYDSEIARGNSKATASARGRMIQNAWQWMSDHESHGDLVPRVRAADLPSAPSAIAPWAPSWAEMDAVVLAARNWYRRLFVLQRYTGLRTDQVMKLVWGDVDLDEATITVRHGKSRQEKRPRTVPISQHLVAELAGWGVREGFIVDTTDVPASARPGKHRTPGSEPLHSIWKRALGKVPPQPTHGMRRGFITGLRAAGVDVDLVKVLVGHARGVTGDVYTDTVALMPQLREAVAKVPPIATSPAVRPLRVQNAGPTT